MKCLQAEIWWVRQFVALGLLAYLGSFYFLNSSHQKTIFYLLVAIPSLFLLSDIRLLLKKYRLPTLLVFSFFAYFSLSSLWSNNGQLMDSMRYTLSITSLMLAIHSTMSIMSSSERVIRYSILIIGAFACSFYCFIIISKIISTGEYLPILSHRFSLGQLSGWGDGNPINSAIYFSLVVLASWWTIPQSQPLAKMGLFLLIGASMMVIFLSKSRGPFISIVLVIGFISVLKFQKKDYLFLLGTLAVITAAVAYLNLMPLILDRATYPNYRVGIWLSSIELIRDNLFFGQGFGDSVKIPLATEGGEIVTVSHSHSSLLEVFRVGGIVGGGIFLAMLISIVFRHLAINRYHSFFVFWLILGLLSLSTNGRFLLIRPSIEWFAFWIPLFLIMFSPSNPHQPSEGTVDRKHPVDEAVA